MSGELLTLIAITFGAPLATVLFLHITGANAYREMERRQARFREAYGDVPRVHPEAIARERPGSRGRGGVIKTAPALVRTRHSHHDGSATNL